jgi:alpha-L-rhamnosidase
MTMKNRFPLGVLLTIALLMSGNVLSVSQTKPPPVEPVWRGRWIWLKGTENERNFYLYARRTFDLERVPKSAPVRMTADSRYKLWVNGRFVGRGPARSDPAWLYYDRYDLAPYLRKGHNVVAVLVDHYGDGTFQYLPAPAGLLFEAQMGAVRIASDESWKVRRADAYRQDLPKIDLQLPAMEEFDARKEPTGWTQAEMDDTHWTRATVLGPVGLPPHVHLVPRDIPFLREQPVRPARLLGTYAIGATTASHHIDLRPFFAADVDGEAYLLTYMRSPKAQKLTFHVGSDDGVKLWVGGVKILSYAGHRTAAPDQSAVTMDMWNGEALVLAQVRRPVDRSRWNFYFRVTGEDGKPQPIYLDWQKSGGEYLLPSAGKGAWKVTGPFDSSEQAGGPFCKDDLNMPFPAAFSNDNPAAVTAGLADKRSWRRAETDPGDSESRPVWERMQREPLLPREKEPRGAPFVGAAWPEKLVVRQSPVALVLDMGHEMLGFPHLKVDAPAGTVIDFGYSELLENGRVVPDRAGVHYADRLICREGVQTYDLFTPRAFRYWQIDVRTPQPGQEVVLEEVAQNYATYPVEYRGAFTCSDTTLNAIWKLGRYTVQQCMEDGYTDCPWRERGQWWGDARAEAFTTYYAFGDARLIRKAILQIAQGQYPDGITPGVWPAAFDGRRLPDFCLIWVMTLDDYVRFTGDVGFARTLFPQVTKALAWFEPFKDRDGLLRDVPYWVFIDWANIDKAGACTALNAYYVGALQAAERLAQRLGETNASLRWHTEAMEQAQALNSTVWSEAERAYVDSLRNDGKQSTVISEQANALCVLFGIADAEKERRLLARLAENQSKPTVRCGSPYFSFYWLWAMHTAGRHAQAIDYIRRHWKVMLDAGATTAWEVWGQGASLCHGWSSGPTSLLPAWVLGVRPLADGMNRVLIAPQTGGLAWARGAVPTPHGPVRVDWKRVGAQLTLRAETPKGVEADVVVPGQPALLRRDGHILVSFRSLPDGVHFTLKGGSKIVLEAE